MKNSIIILFLFVCFVSCIGESSKPFSGNDINDIAANLWMNQVNLKDHFLRFDENGEGWETEVENSSKQWHGWLSKDKFSYTVDTLQKIIIITYKDSKKRKAWSYQMIFEDEKRILELNGIPYIDGQDEINKFGSNNSFDVNIQ